MEASHGHVERGGKGMEREGHKEVRGKRGVIVRGGAKQPLLYCATWLLPGTVGVEFKQNTNTILVQNSARLAKKS